MLTDAIVIREFGAPDVLRPESVEVPAPRRGEARIRQTAIGLNFVDIYHRSGQFGSHDSPPLPAILGVQGAGIVEALGPDTTGLEEGDTVGYVGQIGAYARHRSIAVDRLLKLPNTVPADLAAASLVRGLTSEYLLRRLYRVQPGDTILIHAAAGGVGRIACQWANALGAIVIGTVGSDEKAGIARANGCHHPIVYTREDFVARVGEITDGRGVAVVYDSVGKDTFLRSLDCLRPRGMAINFGTASGQVEDFPLQLLHVKSLVVSRPTLPSFIASRSEYVAAADAFFRVLESGAVKIDVGERYPLAEASRAHADMESRKAAGLPVLIP